jgi:superfamily II DNA/RNA helicase
VAVGEPAIVFTEYRDTLDACRTSAERLDCVLLHGGMTPAERRHAAQRFTQGNAVVLLATDAASEG